MIDVVYFFSLQVSRFVLLWFPLFVYLYQLLCKPHACLSSPLLLEWVRAYCC